MRDPWVINTEFQLPARCNTLLNDFITILYTNEKNRPGQICSGPYNCQSLLLIQFTIFSESGVSLGAA